MLSWQSPEFKTILRPLSIIIIEFFLLSISPVPISEVDINIRSLSGLPSPLKADSRQLKPVFKDEAPNYLIPPLLSGKSGKEKAHELLEEAEGVLKEESPDEVSRTEEIQSYILDQNPRMVEAALSIFERAIPPEYVRKSKVLDLATGRGLIARYAVEHGASEVTGVDILPEMLAEAAKNVPGLRTVKGDILKVKELLRRADGTVEKFNIVTLANVLTFKSYEERKQILAQVTELLEEGGYVAILYRTYDEEKDSHKHSCAMLPMEYKKLLEDVGFTVAGFYEANLETDDDMDYDLHEDYPTVENRNIVVWARLGKPTILEAEPPIDIMLTKFRTSFQSIGYEVVNEKELEDAVRSLAVIMTEHKDGFDDLILSDRIGDLISVARYFTGEVRISSPQEALDNIINFRSDRDLSFRFLNEVVPHILNAIGKGERNRELLAIVSAAQGQIIKTKTLIPVEQVVEQESLEDILEDIARRLSSEEADISEKALAELFDFSKKAIPDSIFTVGKIEEIFDVLEVKEAIDSGVIIPLTDIVDEQGNVLVKGKREILLALIKKGAVSQESASEHGVILTPMADVSPGEDKLQIHGRSLHTNPDVNKKAVTIKGTGGGSLSSSKVPYDINEEYYPALYGGLAKVVIFKNVLESKSLHAALEKIQFINHDLIEDLFLAPAYSATPTHLIAKISDRDLSFLNSVEVRYIRIREGVVLVPMTDMIKLVSTYGGEGTVERQKKWKVGLDNMGFFAYTVTAPWRISEIMKNMEFFRQKIGDDPRVIFNRFIERYTVLVVLLHIYMDSTGATHSVLTGADLSSMLSPSNLGYCSFDYDSLSTRTQYTSNEREFEAIQEKELSILYETVQQLASNVFHGSQFTHDEIFGENGFVATAWKGLITRYEEEKMKWELAKSTTSAPTPPLASAQSFRIPAESRANHYLDEQTITVVDAQGQEQIVSQNDITVLRQAVAQYNNTEEGTLVTLNIKAKDIQFTVVRKQGVTFLVQSDVITKTEGEIGSALEAALAQEDLQGLSKDEPYIITTVTCSPRLFGNCTKDRFIYINESFFNLDTQAKSLLLQTGLEHELYHEVTGEGASIEGQLRARDMRRLIETARQKHINLPAVLKRINNAGVINYEFEFEILLNINVPDIAISTHLEGKVLSKALAFALTGELIGNEIGITVYKKDKTRQTIIVPLYQAIQMAKLGEPEVMETLGIRGKIEAGFINSKSDMLQLANSQEKIILFELYPGRFYHIFIREPRALTAKALERGGVVYGEYNPDSNEITIDITESKEAFKIIAPELAKAASYKVTGFVHAHEIFHQLVKRSGISLDSIKEENLADIFAKKVFGFTLTRQEGSQWNDFEGFILKNAKEADYIINLSAIRYDETEIADTDNKRYGIRKGDRVETGRFIVELQKLLGDELYNISKVSSQTAPANTPEAVKVLVVDDDRHMLEATKEMLSSPEISTIETANSMDEGIKALASNPDINFLVIDFRLDPLDLFTFVSDPERPDQDAVNGVQLCKQAFRKYNFKGKVVIYSADDTPIISQLRLYPDLWDMYLEGQISVQLKHDTGAFETIKGRIIAFARGEKTEEQEAIDMKILEEELPLEVFTIKPDDVGVSAGVIEQFKDCHVIIADDKPFIRNAIGATVKGFFSNTHKLGTIEDVVGLVKDLRAKGVPDEKIIILSDYEFGTEQTGIRRSDGRDLLNMLRLHPNSGYEKETLNFKGFFFFISGSIISKDQIPGFNKSTKDIDPEIKTKYGIDYVEKNADENFPLMLLKMVYARLQVPYQLSQVITDSLPRKEMSKPADVSFLNGGVNDFEARLMIGLRQLKDSLTEFAPQVKDKEKIKKIEETLSKMSAFFDFGNVDRNFPFNARTHNYKGRIFYVASYLVPQIRKEIESLSPSEKKKYEPFISKLDSLALTMGVAANYMLRLLRLSSAVGNTEMPITFDEFIHNTVEVFLADYGDRVTIQTDFDRESLRDLELPYGLTFVVSYILDNAFDQYQLKYGTEFKGKVYFNVNKEQQIVEISIIDEAGGIDKKILPNIFQRKFSTKPQHSGYGLFWARQLLEMFDGEITAHNEAKGARFSIRLPLEWKSIVQTKMQIPEELVRQVYEVLSNRGIPDAEERAERIAKEIYAYSLKISEITQTRETISYESFTATGHKSIRYKIENMLPNYFQAICTGDYQVFRDIIFEKGTTQEEIENLLLSLLALSDVEKKEDIVFSYLPPRQAAVLKYDAGGMAQILLRSKENLLKEKDGITQEMREKYQRVLRQVGYAIHKLGGDVGMIGSSWYFLCHDGKISQGTSDYIERSFREDLPNEVYGMIHTYTNSEHQLSGFEDDILWVERVDGWVGAISDQVQAFVNAAERLKKALEGVNLEEKDRKNAEFPNELASKAQILLKLLYGQKFYDKEFLDISSYPAESSRMSGNEKFHFMVEPGTRLWLDDFFLDNIMLNMFRCKAKDEDLYINVKEEDGSTLFTITYKGHIDLDTIFKPKRSRSEPWYAGPLLHDLIETVSGEVIAQNAGENVRIQIRFPLPEGLEPIMPEPLPETVGVSADPATVKRSLTAFVHNDPAQNFSGVDLEHFVHAQYRLAERDLQEEVLRTVLEKLGLPVQLTGEEAYGAIYQKLAEGSYTKELIDLINGNTYSDPRLAIEIIGQSPNPRAQAAYEAIANSLDALGFSIGQHGKGVKQIIAWLESAGEDRIDVFTREDSGTPYQLTILKDIKGQWYIQIKKVSVEEFQSAVLELTEYAQDQIEHGTVVKITTKSEIPRTDTAYGNSQKSLIDGIHKIFPFVTSVNVTTKKTDDKTQSKVNGFEEKEIIIPPDSPPFTPDESAGRYVYAVVTDHTVNIMDNGVGMDAQVISRMFVPKEGTKHPKVLSAEEAQEELKKLKVVQDRTLPHRVSFARNSRVILAIDIPADIMESATATGGLMLELGQLVDVPESWDNIIIPLDLKPGEISNFQLAIEYVISQIIYHPSLSNLDKVKLVNTIVVGLDGLVKSNENYDYAVKNIRSKAQKSLAQIIIGLRDEGYAILPHNNQFTKLALPQDKKGMVFIHEKLFDWSGALNLRELGGEIVSGLSLGGDKRLPLVIIPFTPESTKDISVFNRLWHLLRKEDRLPIIKTESFIALPAVKGTLRLLELSKRRTGGLNKKEEKEFNSLLQMVNILTAEHVITSYEVTPPKQNIMLDMHPQFEKSSGEIDSDAVNSFLIKAPLQLQKTSPAGNQVPSDAQQKYIVLKNGDLVYAGTTNPIERNVRSIEYLSNGHYLIRYIDPFDAQKDILSIAQIDENGVVNKTKPLAGKVRVVYSPDKKRICLESSSAKQESIVFDTENGGRGYPLSTDFYMGFQFSSDSAYVACFEITNSGDKNLIVIDLIKRRLIKRIPLPHDVYEFSMNPFAPNIMFIQNKQTGLLQLLDLNLDGLNNVIYSSAKYLHTDSSGSYTAAVFENGEMHVYFHKAKQTLTEIERKKIKSVATKWQNHGNVYYIEIMLEDGSIQRFFERGSPLSGTSPHSDYAEEFGRDGMLRVFYTDSPGPIQGPIRVDPLQRLEQKGVYRHRDSKMVIDNANPANPEAVDVTIRARIPFKGKIISFTLGTPLVSAHNGRIRTQDTGIFEEERGIWDGRPFGYYVVSPSGRNYELRRTTIAAEEISKLPFFEKEYPEAVFDGTYFVFINRTSGNVVYLNPEKPGEPVFISSTRAFVSEIKPVFAPNRFVISRDASGRNFIIDESKNKAPVSFLLYDEIVRINSDTFAVYTPSYFQIIQIVDIQHEKVLMHQSISSQDDVRILAHTDRLVALDIKVGSHRKQCVYDIQENKYYPPAKDARKSYFSSSKRYSIHEDRDGNLLFKDHAQSGDMQPLTAAGTYSEYVVRENADLVIWKDLQGKFILFGLAKGKILAEKADHIEIDSSGKVIMIKKNGSLTYMVLKNDGDTIISNLSTDNIKIASDDEFIYVIATPFGEQRPNAYLYKKDDPRSVITITVNDFVEPKSGFNPPRFWEEYEVDLKTIWDLNMPIQAHSSISASATFWAGWLKYASNPPTNQTQTIVLKNSMLVNMPTPYGRLDYLFDLENKKVWETEDPASEYNLMSLAGDKVWYEEKKDGSGIRNVRIRAYLDQAEQSYRGIAINQSRTFILAFIESDFPRRVLINSEGEVFPIDERLISPIFMTSEINGDCFVFIDPDTRNSVFLDPWAAFSGAAPQPKASEDEEKLRRALELWENEILPKRDMFIAQAQDAYQPFVALIEEYFSDNRLTETLRLHIKQLYETQEREIRNRFKRALDDQPLDLTSLPFDTFAARIPALTPQLREHLESVKAQIAQEDAESKRIYYTSLFSNIFLMAANQDLKFSHAKLLEPEAYFAIGLGWNITSQSKLDDINIITGLVKDLISYHSGLAAPDLGELEKIILFLNAASSISQGKHETVIRQLKKLLEPRLASETSPGFPEPMPRHITLLMKLREAFRKAEFDTLRASLNDPRYYNELADARAFVVFLTNDVEQVMPKERFIPEGEDIAPPEGGVYISQLIKLEQERPKSGDDDNIMDIEYLLEYLEKVQRNETALPRPSEALEAEIRKNITIQRESGAYAAEAAQNSKDAQAQELVVDFYLQKNESGREEYVEEMSDNGTGALKEVALLINKSTKAIGEQIDFSGFFGTGKFTFFEGIDRLEIINKNKDRAFMFIFSVVKDGGKIVGVKLTGIRKVNDEKIPQGLTVRRIKSAENTIPELDQMLSRRAWKTFAGFSQNDSFKIYFIDEEGKRRLLEVEHELLSESDFVVTTPEGNPMNFGKMQVIGTKDMPLQIIDRAGLRVSELKEEYLALIPYSLRGHIKELGINIQIPLPLIRGRSSFEREDYYLPFIQKYVAIEFYKAIAYKTLTQTSPQFIFENFPVEWETNDDYWSAIDLNDKTLIELVSLINGGEYEGITDKALRGLLGEAGKLDKEKKFLKLILMLEVVTDPLYPEERVSLIGRRLALQREIDKTRAIEQEELLRLGGLLKINIPRGRAIPHYDKKIAQSRIIQTAHEQMKNPERYIIDSKSYSPEEQELVRLALSIGTLIGIEQVILVTDDVRFAGAFKIYKDKHTMFLKKSIAAGIGKPDRVTTDITTNIIIHELAHLLEEFMVKDDADAAWQSGFVTHAADFTHDAVGTFAEAMKYIAALWLANHEAHTGQAELPPSGKTAEPKGIIPSAGKVLKQL
ncbi:MAG: ATP-binding protein [Candidatus Omnitrophota bacterium]